MFAARQGFFSPEESWQIASFAYTGSSFSVASQDNVPVGIFFKPDGTKMFIIGDQNDDVYEYSLSTAWDITSASFTTNFSILGTDVEGLTFKPDGTKMYYARSSEIREYDLSTAWSISTLSFVQAFSISSQDTSPTNVFFRPNGLKMYVTGSTNDAVYEYTLSSAWDISTASYVQNFSVLPETRPTGIFFAPDGYQMYISGWGNSAVEQYNLTTAWDISTASLNQSLSVLSQDEFPQGIYLRSDGNLLFMVGRTADSVFAYSNQ